ncbi:MAG TPA: helix-turn-helix domain-containing protein [Chryseosolibacter sp.]|nr:helix-turn-helix domain-containing protein [Chryseosolibacter sp.]
MENPFHVLEAKLNSIETLLIDIRNKPNVTPESKDEIGGVELARKITGYSLPTIYGLVSARKIPHSKVGKKLFFSRDELSQWVKAGKRASVAELKEKARTF